MRETVMPRSSCPSCGYSVDGASDFEGQAVPKPGDVSICLNCAAARQTELLERIANRAGEARGSGGAENTETVDVKGAAEAPAHDAAGHLRAAPARADAEAASRLAALDLAQG
jgi:hypothetical protein